MSRKKGRNMQRREQEEKLTRKMSIEGRRKRESRQGDGDGDRKRERKRDRDGERKREGKRESRKDKWRMKREEGSGTEWREEDIVDPESKRFEIHLVRRKRRCLALFRLLRHLCLPLSAALLLSDPLSLSVPLTATESTVRRPQPKSQQQRPPNQTVRVAAKRKSVCRWQDETVSKSGCIPVRRVLIITQI